MFDCQRIEKESDTLIDLLTAQCADLENLLALARAETVAAEEKNFEKILEIVSERSEIAHRLETFQRQISNFRENLESAEAVLMQNKTASRIVEIANLTLAQDKQTKLLLTADREEAATGLANLEKSQRGANAYLNAAGKGLAYNQSF